jgi:[acyl-carrier-protein] S-malonyltransferase
MGRDLVAVSEAARRTFEEADDVLGFPLSRLCFEGSSEELTLTSNAQPAILVHSVAVQRALGDDIQMVAAGAGHSLGEFSAYVVAGTIEFAEAVRTVRLRGELMAASGRDRPGTMAALLGLDDDAATALCARVSTEEEICVPANFNAPGQIVLSGDVAAVERAIAGAKDAGAKRALRLNVSGAFHSPLMEVAVGGLHDRLDAVPMRDPAFPVVSNVTAEPVTDAATARALLIRQLTSPVRWTECVRALLDLGATRFIELGPGSVLAGLMKRIDGSAAVHSIGGAEDLASVRATI